jgi:Transglycosylase SLT domain
VRYVAGGLALLLTIFLALPLAFAPGDSGAAPSAAAAEIPPLVLAAYQRFAGTCPGLRWQLLAGVGKVESGHGTAGGAQLQPDGEVVPFILGPPLDGQGAGGNTTALPVGPFAGQWGLTGPWQQALGPMQLLPGTFQAWAVDGNADGRTDPHQIDDAVATAANYLCGPAHAVTDERAALLRYNHSDAYVDDVLRWAAVYSTSSTLVIGPVPSADEVLADANLDIYPGGRDDIAAGIIDPRILQLLVPLGREHRITVTALSSGHSRCIDDQPDVAGCTVSNHFYGRAVDIGAIDGQLVSAANPTAIAVMHELAALDPPLRPDEIGGPVDTGEPGVFTDGFHTDHLHIGYRS